ncbi:MAG: TIGR03067 domain-containing protein [Gemmatimonadota bacterium]
MTHSLPPRPNLEHLRGQAKSLLAAWRSGDRDATQAFIDFLPKARDLTVAAARRAAFSLADAQSVIARRNGFPSWSNLTRHVEILRGLEGEWRFESLQVDGQQLPAAMLGHSRLLFDGDRFRMESPEGHYDGHFAIDTARKPMRLDIAFVEGPEAGNSSYGIFQLNGDALTICLGLVGSSRPTAFKTTAGSGHALEELRRTSTARPAGVSGGVARPRESARAEAVPSSDPGQFGPATSPLLQQLEGEWSPVRLVANGAEMGAEWLAYGLRMAKGNEVKVVFGGQVMVHAKVRIDDSTSPTSIDYLHLAGAGKGKVSHGIMEWIGSEVVFLMAGPGQPRPADFASPSATQTLSQWRPRG